MISLALVALLSASPLSPADEKAASVDGKYTRLLRVMTMPEDRAQHGALNDWGWWSGTAYKGHEGLKPGYWVWVSPRWYIWGEKKAVEHEHLIRTVEAPGDEARYGKSYDYGWWSGTSYLGQNDLPPAYWTYKAPRWYLWRD